MDAKKIRNKKIKAFALCTAVFVLVYNFSSWHTSQLQFVPSLVFNFEKNIPFLPWTILPYMTSGIFFCLVFFSCKNSEQLGVLTKRMLFITLSAGIVYFLFPLKFSRPKPEVVNPFLSPFFELLKIGDSPYNQAPSLHIAYAFLFWTVFKNFKPAVKYILGIWLFLLGISTLTTFQHHFVDVISGLIIAQFSLVLFPLYPKNFNYRNSHVANYYYLAAGTVSFLMLFLIYYYSFYALFFIWIFTILSVMGYNYQRDRIYFLKNKEGKISVSRYVFYFPYLFIYWFFWKFFRRNIKPVEIFPKIFISSKPDKKTILDLLNLAEVTVYDLSAELEETIALKNKSEYFFKPFLDIGFYNVEVLRDLVEEIVVKYNQLPHNGKILIHCTMGYSRSAVVGILVMKKILYLPLDKAILKLKKNNKNTVISNDLQNFLKKHQL